MQALTLPRLSWVGIVAAAFLAGRAFGGTRLGLLSGGLFLYIALFGKWTSAMLTLGTRPRSHTLLSTLAAAAVGTAAGGPVHGWAGFAGLTSHLLRDAGDDAAATPLLWPFRPPRQIGRSRAAVGIAALTLGSVAISRRAARAGGPTSAAAADTDGAPEHPRTG